MPMKNRGKSVKPEKYKSNFFSDSNYSVPSSSKSEIPCKKHPLNSSFVGICAYCLNEKLINLVCSSCGEQRLSYCSCSDLNSNRDSSCTVDVGSVGRISVLIENEKGSNGDNQKTLYSHLKIKQSETEDVVLLKRSNSCGVEVKKSNGFWRIGSFFKKKRDKSSSNEIESIPCSNAKSSDFYRSEPTNGGFKGGKMNFGSGITVKETDLSLIDDDHGENDEFIEINIDLSENLKTECSVFRKCDQLDSSGERGLRKVKNRHMNAWNWTVKSHSGNDDLSQSLKY